jgi:hypothetical protein
MWSAGTTRSTTSSCGWLNGGRTQKWPQPIAVSLARSTKSRVLKPPKRANPHASMPRIRSAPTLLSMHSRIGQDEIGRDLIWFPACHAAPADSRLSALRSACSASPLRS